MFQLLARRTNITEQIIERLRNWHERISVDRSDDRMDVIDMDSLQSHPLHGG